MECTIEHKKQVKLDLVVNAALVDTYADSGRYFQRANFMAARGLKKLYVEALPKLRHKVWLVVNGNTRTATLPLDFESETWVGGLDCNGRKFHLKLNNKITDSKNIIDIPCEDACPKCNQDRTICNDLAVTEETNLIVINDSTYEQTIVKKLYPNGDYYLEKTTPVLNLSDNTTIDYAKTKEFITNLDLKPCGCLETTPENLAKVQTYCPDTYCNYYAPCDSACNTELGGYRIFEESGLIQFDARYPYEKVYLEYNGFISKINGQYYVPMVSFETLVEYIKWKLIANKSNVPRWERLDQFESYKRERRNMEKVMGRISLAQIIQSIAMLPKFDVDYSCDWYSCFCLPDPMLNISSDDTSNSATMTSNTDCCVTSTTTIINRTAFTLAVRATTVPNTGVPVAGESTYQNNVLKNALDVHSILLAKQILTILDRDFSIDTTTGTVDISPNVWQDGDSLIINYNKNL